MKRTIGISIILLMTGCSSQTTDNKSEIETAKNDLFINVLESVKNKDWEKSLESIPETGQVSVVFGEIMKVTKEGMKKIYEGESNQIQCESYEILDGPTIEIIESDYCYGTAVIQQANC